MKIAINSPMFLPRIGGLENVTAMLAGHFAKRGHEVRVLTITPADEGGEPDVGYSIIRDPKGSRLWETAKWCDVFVHSNMSLKAVHPLLLLRKPWIAIHHGWYSDANNPPTLNAKAKRFLARFATSNIAISHYVADYIGGNCQVIPNPYDDWVFRERSEIRRDRDLLFVGRLVSDKGANLLVEAVGRLVTRGLHPTLTITGTGPEEEALRQQTTALDLKGATTFAGALRGEALAKLMNAHRFIVIPSIWKEPFGIVAIEGIACGCIAVGSNGGGLKEAIGPCGISFQNGDASDLTRVLADVLSGNISLNVFHAAKQAHLERHKLETVGDAYLKVLLEVTSVAF